MSDKPLTHEEFVAIYSKVPRLCVEVVIKTDQGILLTLRKDKAFRGMWHFPGGTVYYREALNDAVKRVALSELGVAIEVKKFLGILEYFSEEKQRGFGYAVGLAYLCEPKTTNYKLDDQVSELGFFTEVPSSIVIEQGKFITETIYT